MASILDFFGSGIREIFTSTVGNSVSEILKIAGDGKTVLTTMDDALVENTDRRIKPLIQFVKEQFLHVSITELEERAQKGFDLLFKDENNKYMDHGREISDKERRTILTQMVNSQKSFNLIKVVEDKVDFYLDHVRGNEEKFKNSKDAMLLADFVAHEVDIGVMESWRNNRNNIRMARSAINEMQTFSQGQNALIHFLTKTKLISGEVSKFLNEMSTVIDFFEPMSQTDADKFRMSNYKWDELSQKYANMSVTQKKLAAFFTTQTTTGWHQYLGLGANAMHEGVGSVVSNILQVRTLFVRELFEECSLNLLKAYKENKEIDIVRSVQPKSFEDTVEKSRSVNWNSREFFKSNYGIELPKSNSEADVNASITQINKAMLVDAMLEGAKVRATLENNNRGWGLIESNREYLHFFVKTRMDLHPAVAYRWDGDAKGASAVKAEWDIKSEEGNGGRRGGKGALDETGHSAYVTDMKDKFSFINEHFFKAAFDMAAVLKTGDNPKSLIEQYFSICDIKGLPTSKAEFLVTNGYDAYKEVPEVLRLPTAHRPRLSIKDEKKNEQVTNKMFYQMLYELPVLPELSHHEEVAEKQKKYFDEIKAIHEKHKSQYVATNQNTIDIDHEVIRTIPSKIDLGSATKTKIDQILSVELPEDRKQQFYPDIPIRKEIQAAYQETLKGMQDIIKKGKIGQRFHGIDREGDGSNMVTDAVTAPSEKSLAGKATHSLGKVIKETSSKIEENKRQKKSTVGLEIKKFFAKTGSRLIKWSVPVLAAGAVASFFVPISTITTVAALGAGTLAAGYGASKLLTKGLGLIHDGRATKGIAKVVGYGLPILLGIGGFKKTREYQKEENLQILNQQRKEIFVESYKNNNNEINGTKQNTATIKEINAGDTVIVNKSLVVAAADTKLYAPENSIELTDASGRFKGFINNDPGSKIYLISRKEMSLDAKLIKVPLKDKVSGYEISADGKSIKITDWKKFVETSEKAEQNIQK